MTTHDPTLGHAIWLPKMSRKSSYAQIVAWLKEEGDRVQRGDAILVMETDKATIELQAQVSGILIQVLCPAGQWLPISMPVGVIRSDASLESEK